MSYASRVTIDIDSYLLDLRLAAVRAYTGLGRAADEVEVRISASGEGLHIIGWFEDPLTERQKDAIRRHLGDDPNRAHLDEGGAWGARTRATTNVCWTTKHVDSDPQHADKDFEDVWDALDHITVSEPPAERLRRAVQAGLVR